MCALVGWLVCVTLFTAVQRWAPRRWDPLPKAPPMCLLHPDEPAEPPRVSPRSWRSIPNVGPTRALALTRALWEAGASRPQDINLTQIHGIGPITAERILNSWDDGAMLSPSDWLPRSSAEGPGWGGYTRDESATCPFPPIPLPRTPFSHDGPAPRMPWMRPTGSRSSVQRSPKIGGQGM